MLDRIYRWIMPDQTDVMPSHAEPTRDMLWLISYVTLSKQRGWTDWRWYGGPKQV